MGISIGIVVVTAVRRCHQERIHLHKETGKLGGEIR
jgi:hypothetical protein